MSQKPQLQELIESCGHLCKFYPKYHCELNFIKQYWGAAKLQFRMVGHMATMDEMEQKIINCLDDIHSFKFSGESSTFFFSSYLPHHDIFCSYTNQSVHFILAYHIGLTGSQAIWANKKYHSHRTLPPDVIAEVKCSLVL